MKKALYIITLILIYSCHHQEKQNSAKISTVEQKWKLLNSKDSIPKLMISVMKKITKDSFKIANPNENFEKTDVILNDSLPRRQLRILAKKNDNWRMSYIQGGFGKYYVYVESKINKDSISNFKIETTTLKLENLDSIEKYLKTGVLKPKPVTIVNN